MPQPIFRSIEVDHGQRITLGEPIPPAVQRDLTPPDGGQRFMLPGTFGGASSIEVDTSPVGTVQQMVFTYATGTDYAAMLANFEDELGAPGSQSGSAPARDRRSVWTDSATRFTLSETPEGDGASVGSLLEDLADAGA